MKRHLKLIGIIFVVLTLVVASAGCLSTDTTQVTEGQYKPTQPPISEQPKEVTGVVGDIFTSEGTMHNIAWMVRQVIRGSQANSIVANGNMFNEEPAPGYEYILYEVGVENLDDEKYSVSPSTWQLYANGIEAEICFAVLPDSYHELRTINIMPGAVTYGWIVHQIPIGSSARVYFEPMYGNSQLVYVNL